MANFLLLLHQTPGRFRNLSPEEIQKILGSYIAWRDALVKRNKMRAGEKLTERRWPALAHARRKSIGDGRAVQRIAGNSRRFLHD